MLTSFHDHGLHFWFGARCVEGGRDCLARANRCVKV